MNNILNKKKIITDLNEGLIFFNSVIEEFTSYIEENSLKDEFLLKININNEQYVLDLCADLAQGVTIGLEPLGYHNIYCEDCLKQDFEGILDKVTADRVMKNKTIKKIIKLYNNLSSEKEISIEIKNTIIEIPKSHKHFVWCLKDALLDELHDYVII